jgi:hypothetical protein
VPFISAYRGNINALPRRGHQDAHIQAILGHKSLQTTQIYTHVSIGSLVKVHRKTHPARLLRSSRKLVQKIPSIPNAIRKIIRDMKTVARTAEQPKIEQRNS